MTSETPRWLTDAEARFPKLAESIRCDVVVIGGGITGLTTALQLQREGRSVCLLEKGKLGGGETGHTSAHLAYVTDQRLPRLVRTFGEDAARAAWEAGAAAIDFIESFSKMNGIDCGFKRVPGCLHASLTEDDSDAHPLEEDYELARRLGFPAHWVDSVPGVDRPGVLFADQALFHPVHYIQGLADELHASGCRLHENTEVTVVEDDPLCVVANGCRVECDDVVFATHVPLAGTSNALDALLRQSEIHPYSTYVVEAETPPGTLPEYLCWDTSDPYYYLRVDSTEKHDHLIFGGADHKTGQSEDTSACYRSLERLLKKLVPTARIVRRWSGQVIETDDGLPLIGRAQEHQYVATGFAGNGLTFGTVSGLIVCDLIVGRANPWEKLFSSDRSVVLGGPWDYLRENLDYPRFLISDWLTRGERTPASHIGRGEGKILIEDGQRVACSRDQEGKLTRVSAVCSHMGCLVRWNSAEGTWDCPCHGSRFSASGEVIGGPAESPLAPVLPPARKGVATS